MDLAAGDSVILGTPTGSGKSLVALGLAFLALATGRRCWYTAPIKALVSEKFFDFVDVLGRENVGMLTGDAAINADAPVICCTAEVLANTALREGAAAEVDCVVMDEFHFYGDPERGWAWQVPLIELPQAQFLLMSATLGDVTRIAERLEERTGRPVDAITDAPRPVPLEFRYSLRALEAAVELALRAGEGPIYVVHFTQDGALQSAQSLASFGVAGKERRDAVREAMKGTRFTTPFGKTLKRLLGAGVGVHHAGMLPRYRLLVERLAQQGLLEVICGTDTLGVGINVPIHTVLLTALAKFDGTRVRRLNAREFHQIAGRAGRAGFDVEGVVVAQAPEHEIENEKLRLKAAGDPKRERKLKRKQPPKGFVGWSERTFEQLIEKPPETLVAHFEVSHAMVLALVARSAEAARAQGEGSQPLPHDAVSARAQGAASQPLPQDADSARAQGAASAEASEGSRPLPQDVPDAEAYAGSENAPVADAPLAPLAPSSDASAIPAAPAGEGCAQDDPADAWQAITDLIRATDQPEERQLQNLARAREILNTLIDTGVVVATPEASGRESYALTIDLPQDFALDQPLSPFFLAALDLLDKDDPDYALDVISLAEAVLEDPRQVLRAQERKAKDELWQELRAQGVDVEERKERVADVSWPKPLEELIAAAYEAYCVKVPWARDYAPSPKSVLRQMVETASGFRAYIGLLGIARSEGILLRYLSDAYHLLSRSLPPDAVDERLGDVIAWLGYLVRTTDSSLVDAWEGAGAEEAAPPSAEDVVVVDRHGLEVQVRNALFERVLAAARGDWPALGELDGAYGYGAQRWREILDGYYAEHDAVLTDADARSTDYFELDESPEREERRWRVRQTFRDPDGDRDFQIQATVDLDATQESGEVVFAEYKAGFFEDL